MNKYLVANFGELFLKGGNISYFEEKLYLNFLEKIKPIKNKVTFEKKKGGAFFLKLANNIREDEINFLKGAIKNTPGFVTYYLAYTSQSNLDDLKKIASEVALEFIKKNPNIKTFGLKTEKTDQGSNLKTNDVNVEVGSAV
jgi:adenylyl- and sulfurtransferase ThiI